MKCKFLKICVLFLFLFLALSGCALNAEEEETAEPGVPANAIYPVMANERAGIKSTLIPLSDFNLVLPSGYVYGKIEREDMGYTAYYVWQDKKNKEYSYELDGDILLYIYDGVDVNSPHREITPKQALMSMKTGYMATFANIVALRNRMPDAEVGISDDERYYTFTFTGNSGKYITTSYADSCYPKTYYGIYTMEAQTNDSDRNYYGFIFSNDAQGEIFKQSEYESLLSQIKTGFNVSKFYGLPNQDQALDFSDGKSYKQLVADVLYENEGTNRVVRGAFYNSLLYYIETTGRNYVRKNVDVSKSQMAEKDLLNETLSTDPTEEAIVLTEDALGETISSGDGDLGEEIISDEVEDKTAVADSTEETIEGSADAP